MVVRQPWRRPGATATKPMGALVRATLAIYITLFAVVVMATAQVLYWKLVLSREDVAPAKLAQSLP